MIEEIETGIAENEKISPEIQFEIIRRKIEMWKNSRYDAELDARVAARLGDKVVLKQAEEKMKTALKAIDLLKEIQAELPQGDIPLPQTSHP